MLKFCTTNTEGKSQISIDPVFFTVFYSPDPVNIQKHNFPLTDKQQLSSFARRSNKLNNHCKIYGRLIYPTVYFCAHAMRDGVLFNVASGCYPARGGWDCHQTRVK